VRVAVIGSGPAGFYAASALLAADPPPEVDMIERLPTPWGLVRLGVAPDHPKLKEVSRAFERTAAQPGFRFFGNVEVGRDVTHDELVRLYDAVIYTVGAQTDRRLGIPGEDLPGSWPALAFVAWYNGHPDFDRVEFDLSCERAVVVGNGNVALDIARMLALTREELAVTDIADPAIDVIAASPIRSIVVLGRRGPVQAAWTPVELGELGELAGADVMVDPADLKLDPASEEELEAAPGTVRRNVDILRGYAAREPEGKPRTIELRFLSSPVAIHGRDRVEAIEVVRNELLGGRAVPTNDREMIPCGVVFRSIGYHGVALPGVPFAEKAGTIPNDCGRVLDASGRPLRGVYCAGWIKRGPTGVIGTNKKDATESVALLLEDAQAGLLAPPEHGTLEQLLVERGIEPVLYSGWEAIDLAERGAGEGYGRPRVKLLTWDELLAAARARSRV
jgi:ferredoxin--NADP+ reductase